MDYFAESVDFGPWFGVYLLLIYVGMWAAILAINFLFTSAILAIYRFLSNNDGFGKHLSVGSILLISFKGLLFALLLIIFNLIIWAVLGLDSLDYLYFFILPNAILYIAFIARLVRKKIYSYSNQ